MKKSARGKGRLRLLAALAAAVCAAEEPQPGYVLGPEDQIVIRALNAEELSEKPVLVSSSGYISLPLVGRVKAAGLTVEQLEAELAGRLGKYLSDPKVAVSVTEYRSQPVSVVGAVTTPGVYQLRGGKTLVEVLSMAGGLRPEAGHVARITRRLQHGRIPLPNAADDASGRFSVAEVNLKSALEARHAADNLLLFPNDIVNVPKAEMVYVMGEVARPGAYVLSDKETLSVLQALALAGGLSRVASAKDAKILRSGEGAAQRAEIAVNVSRILSGRAQDVELRADDILFVPNNAAKSAGLRAVEAAIQLGTGIAIWRR
jgi:polysaccharide export outer membrane protein